MIRVVIADDHRLFADGMKTALSAIPDIDVVATFANGADLLEALPDLNVDVLLLDLEMPLKGGLEVLRANGRDHRVIIVTMHTGAEERNQALELGAQGFLSKSAPLADVAAAVRAVNAGESLVDPTTLSDLLDRHRAPVLDPGAASLTSRERELLALLASGVSATEELADRLYISQKTVKNHLASIYEKLAVSDRAQAAVEAIRLGIGAAE
jgi:DNA-binding NarL/FixJ family response regulator